MHAQVSDLIKLRQKYRNAEELAYYTRRAFLEALDRLEITDEILAWAKTTTYDNAALDEADVARRIEAQAAAYDAWTTPEGDRV